MQPSIPLKDSKRLRLPPAPRQIGIHLQQLKKALLLRLPVAAVLHNAAEAVYLRDSFPVLAARRTTAHAKWLRMHCLVFCSFPTRKPRLSNGNAFQLDDALLSTIRHISGLFAQSV